jgi:hypothetical protein
MVVGRKAGISRVRAKLIIGGASANLWASTMPRGTFAGLDVASL